MDNEKNEDDVDSSDDLADHNDGVTESRNNGDKRKRDELAEDEKREER